MFPFQAYLVATHLDDLQREAAAARRARQAAFDPDDTLGDDNAAGGRSPGSGRRTDLRRALARTAARLSVLADGAARRLDPGLDEAFGGHRANRVAGR